MMLICGLFPLISLILALAVYKLKAEPKVTGIIWSKQFGTDKDESITGVVIDSQGNVYVTGWTEGNLFGTNAGRGDIFIAKFSSDGNLIWGKQLGTKENEIPMDIAVDSDGNIYVVGATDGNLFGQVVRRWYDDAFVAKFSPEGELIWSKQFGTPGQDWATGVAVDNTNRVIYVVGFLQIGEFGDLEAEVFEEVTYSEIFVIKYSFEGDKVWEKHYGAEKDDTANKVCIDKRGNVYIVGETSEWFNKNDNDNAFIVKLTSEGELVWGKEFGTDERDYANDVCVDQNDNIYITGVTNIGGLTWETMDAFIRKYDNNGNLIWSAEIKTKEEDIGNSIITDKEGNIYIVGFTKSNLFGNNLGGSDIFVVKYNSSGELIWGKMIGSEQDEVGEDISIDKQGNIYLVGSTAGNLFSTNSGGIDAFIIKFKQ